jgi:hypothetical protein
MNAAETKTKQNKTQNQKRRTCAFREAREAVPTEVPCEAIVFARIEVRPKYLRLQTLLVQYLEGRPGMAPLDNVRETIDRITQHQVQPPNETQVR